MPLPLSETGVRCPKSLPNGEERKNKETKIHSSEMNEDKILRNKLVSSRNKFGILL